MTTSTSEENNEAKHFCNRYGLGLTLLFSVPVLFLIGAVASTYFHNEGCDAHDDCDEFKYSDLSKAWPGGLASLFVGEVVFIFVVSACRLYNPFSSCDEKSKASSGYTDPESATNKYTALR